MVTDDVIHALVPGGRPYEMETQYWDYKVAAPQIASQATDGQKAEFKAEIADLIKDAVAFYNGCGGYILFGVADKGKDRILGCNVPFDVGDFNKRIEGQAGQRIECLFARLGTDELPLGLLFIPRRPSHIDAIAFKRAAPPHANGKKAYAAGEVYVRIRDECRPATASAADWRFLQGERLPEGANHPVAVRRPLRTSMPPRDAEMIRFVGRETYLGQLRQWLSDKRSPVRLLTGIGGLGKTSVAYHFAEEIVDTRAGGVEQLVWLTAKARTFSALRGQLIEAGRVDFVDAHSLYKVILDRIGYLPNWEDFEPTSEDYVEAIVEALVTYNCFLVLDDIDSLPTGDQREVLFTLSNAAARTVTGDRTPSRILFTSRIDLGISPANVIKLGGFEYEEFIVFVKEVADKLSVPLGGGLDYRNFFTATSGSPLFVTSVLRLVRLGQEMKQALERWRGEEGVEVRRFAFARELERLPLSAARLLYAVCLLNKTSTVELAHVLEMTARGVDAGIGELQSFHLLITVARGTSGAEISAPDDVVLTKDVLKEHLGDGAGVVERTCASARSQTETRENAIASRIGQVVALWQREANAEALLTARKLSQAYQQNGDVTCLLARALTKPGVVDWEEAHRKFILAEKQGSVRPEVIDGLLLTKEHLEDWKGVIALAQKTVSTHVGGGDPLLRGAVRATEELIRISRVRHDRQRRIELAKEAVDLIDRRLNGGRLSPMERDFFRNKELDFGRMLLDDTAAAAARPGDRLTVFDEMAWLVVRSIFPSEFVVRGLGALDQWWTDVEQRTYVDEGAKGLLRKSLGRLEQIERILGTRQPVEDVRRVRTDLAFRGGKLV